MRVASRAGWRVLPGSRGLLQCLIAGAGHAEPPSGEVAERLKATVC